MKTLSLSVALCFFVLAVSAQTEFPAGSEFAAIPYARPDLPVGIQNQPALAFDGTNYLVVWTDFRGDKSAIFGARIAPTGQILDPAGFMISDPAASSDSQPSVAWNGESYLVAWANQFSS